MDKIKILVAPSSFKQSMTAKTATKIIAKEIKKLLPQAKIWKIPLADGGAGTLVTLLKAMEGKVFSCLVSDPIGRKVSASYGIFADKTTAVVEMAASTGLSLLAENERNPMLASSYGFGQLINQTIENKKIRKIILGLGDTATVDGGIGMLQALGVRIWDNQGKEIGQGGQFLSQIAGLDANLAKEKLANIEICIASDVENPLLGEMGAAKVFGPQKGATKEMVLELEKGLENWAKVLSNAADLDKETISKIAGGGAAGGVAVGLISLFGAKIVSGSQLVVDAHKLNEKISQADLIFTGEGAIDSQTLQGKMPARLARLAKKSGVPLIAFTGHLAIDEGILQQNGFSLVVPIVDRVLNLNEAFLQAPNLLALATKRILQAMLLGTKHKNKFL
ncbi:MAG: glycerate kinase [Acidobacteria bacterium]|nr:glycerate kinase [Acidobacteriota bacterium]